MPDKVENAPRSGRPIRCLSPVQPWRREGPQYSGSGLTRATVAVELTAKTSRSPTTALALPIGVAYSRN